MGSCHLHGRGLRRTGADRPPVRAPAGASAPAARCAAAARGGGRGRRRSSRICTPTICTSPSLARLAPGTRLIVPRGRRGARCRGCAGWRAGLRVTEVAPGRRGARSADLARTGRARARTTGGGCRSGRTARRRSAMSSAARRARTSPGTPGCSTRWRRRSGRCDVALLPVGGWGPYLGHGHLDAGRAARGAGAAGAAQRGAGALRHVLADRDGRRAAARIPRAGRGVRAAGGARWRREVAVHRLGHGESVRPEVAR